MAQPKRPVIKGPNKSKGGSDVIGKPSQTLKSPKPPAKNNNKNNKPNKPGKGKGNGMLGFGAHGGYQGIDRKDIKAIKSIVKGQTQAIIDGIRDDNRDIRQDTAGQIRDVRGEYLNNTKDINFGHDESKDFIGYQNNLISERNAATQAKSQQAQQALMQMLAGQTGAIGGEVQGELDRLGIAHSGNGMMDGFGSDANFMSQIAAMQGQFANDNFNAMGSAADQVGNLLMGMNEGQRQAMLGRSLINRDEQIGDLREVRNEGIMDNRDAIRDAKSQSPSVMNQLLMQLAETGWAQYVDQSNISLQNRQLNEQRRQFNVSQRNAMRSGGGSGVGATGSGAYSSISEALFGPNGPQPPSSGGGTRGPQPPSGGKPKKPKGKGRPTSITEPGAHIPAR